MQTAFEITPDDIRNVMESNGQPVSDSGATRLFADVIAPEIGVIEKAALSGGSIQEQTDLAYQEIARILRADGALKAAVEKPVVPNETVGQPRPVGDETLRLEVIPNEYAVLFDPEPWVALEIPFPITHRALNWDHPKILSKADRVFDLKYDNPKRWVQKPGFTITLGFRKRQLQVLPETGYSYPKVLIAGMPAQLNVGGGTDGRLWTDRIGKHASMVGGLSTRSLNALANEALTVEEARQLGVQLRVEDDDGQAQDVAWMNQVARYFVKTALKVGHHVLLNKYTVNGHQVLCFEGLSGAKLRLRVPESEAVATVHGSIIDWVGTAKANSIPIPDRRGVDRLTAADKV